jgi:hypothetical protein
VIAQYWLSLVGLQRHEIGWGRRLLGLTFSVATAPFEFIPLLVAARQKQLEARWVAACEGRAGLTPQERPARLTSAHPVSPRPRAWGPEPDTRTSEPLNL